MSEKNPQLRRTAKGRRPQYFDDPAVDHLHNMVLSLVEELSVTRDRADALERLLEQSGMLDSTQLDEYEADDVAAAERQARRCHQHQRMQHHAARGTGRSDARK